MMRGQRTLEINPDHPLIAGLKDKVDDSFGIAEENLLVKIIQDKCVFLQYFFTNCCCGQRTLEINPDHPLIAGLKDNVGSGIIFCV
jgi:HSP90 family molecular chaperone